MTGIVPSLKTSSLEGSMHFDQSEYDLRCEWGLKGVLALQGSCDAVVIVDVLSFSTAVDVALSRGATVLPYRWRDESAARFAAEQQAILAGRRNAGGEYTLSPASLRTIPEGTRLVLPSPNGSRLCLVPSAVPVFTGCLRNARAVAGRVAAAGSRISMIPAGERWSGDTLRPCLEDLIGAGAILAGLPGTSSPEADLAIAAFERFRANLHDALSRCGSGKELSENGYALDVEIAAEYAVSSVVPVLRNDRLVDSA